MLAYTEPLLASPAPLYAALQRATACTGCSSAVVVSDLKRHLRQGMLCHNSRPRRAIQPARLTNCLRYPLPRTRVDTAQTWTNARTGLCSGMRSIAQTQATRRDSDTNTNHSLLAKRGRQERKRCVHAPDATDGALIKTSQTALSTAVWLAFCTYYKPHLPQAQAAVHWPPHLSAVSQKFECQWGPCDALPCSGRTCMRALREKTGRTVSSIWSTLALKRDKDGRSISGWAPWASGWPCAQVLQQTCVRRSAAGGARRCLCRRR